MAGFKILHDSYSETYRSPFGAVEEGEKIRLRLRIETEEKSCLSDVKLLLWTDGELPGERAMELVEEHGHHLVFEKEIEALDRPGLLWYCFRMNLDGNNCFYGNNEGGFGGIGHVSVFDPKPYQITVFRRGFKTPQWIKDGIMYQIFVDRFNRGKKGILSIKKNSFLYSDWEDIPRYIKDEKGHIARWDFYGGNLEGVIEKLNYLSGLGVSVIYLNPIFEARSNHKYDTGDYMKIDPMFGTEETFERLCQAAGKKGIRIILDGVFSHTGADSRYFNKFGTYDSVGAYQSQESPYYSWYKFKGSRDAYESWWGVLDLPNVDEDNPGYQEFIFGEGDSVINHWLDKGASGWRLDVADELPDGFIEKIRGALKQKDEENLLIGEVWEDATNKISYDKRRTYLLGDGLDGVMNYPYRNNLIAYLTGKLESGCFYRRIMSIKENYPKESLYALMNMSSTHDSIRLLTLLGEAANCDPMDSYEKECYRLADGQKSRAVKRLLQFLCFISTIPGFPSLYYGDEAGVQGFKDPLNRSTFPWGKEDPEIQEWVRKLFHLRNDHQALRTGTFKPFHTDNNLFGYVRDIAGGQDQFGRKAKDERFIMVYNVDMVNGKAFNLHNIVNKEAIGTEYGVFHEIHEGGMVDIAGKGHIMVPPNGFVILQEINGKLKEKVGFQTRKPAKKTEEVKAEKTTVKPGPKDKGKAATKPAAKPSARTAAKPNAKSIRKPKTGV